MSTYERLLPHLFPYRAVLTKSAVAEVVNKLTGTRTDVPSLSSFCVTTGIMHPEGKPTIWLSNASMEFLLRNGNGLTGKVARELRQFKTAQDEMRRREMHMLTPIDLETGKPIKE
jgi:hypothetical protein